MTFLQEISTGGIKKGLLGGLAGTVAMDLVMVSVFLTIGEPADIFFSFIGDAAGAFLSMIGIAEIGGAALGVVLHYSLGLIIGIIFGVLVSRVHALQTMTLGKGIVLGILYTEAVSTTLLAPSVVILQMATSDAFRLLCLAVAFHGTYGAVLGGFVSCRGTKRP